MEANLLFQSELAKSRIEIKEETLTNVSRELHDNIGQILSVALLQMNMIIENGKKCSTNEIIQIKALVTKSLNEIRVISKLINGDIKLNTNFTDSISEDLNRIEMFKKIDCNLKVTGKIQVINYEHQIIIYRILQEAITNILRHSFSEKIAVNIHYSSKNCTIEIIDFGKGFNYNDNSNKGVGLHSIKTRAALIGATFLIDSQSEKGTKIIINYPLLLNNFEDYE